LPTFAKLIDKSPVRDVVSGPEMGKAASFRRGGRPRKNGKRKPSGRLVRTKKPDERFVTAQYRKRVFGIKGNQLINPLAGYLAGVLYLRGKIEVHHLGHFFSFLQLTPTGRIRGAPIVERVQGGRVAGLQLSRRYMRLTRYLGKRMNVLHELANDRLVCPVNTLKLVLEQVPLTRGGVKFMTWCETQHPRNAGPEAKSS
jgi:hypothetical protein